jgi:hypothetical protein
MRQRITIIIGIAALALVATSAALAATLTTTATVTGTAGISLNLPSNPSLSSTLDGTDQTVTYAPVLGVVDARGTGAGWNLTVSATNFSDGSGHTLAPGTITGVAAACKAGNSCTAATSSGITYPLTVSGTSAKFFNAALNTGLGKIDVTPTFAVSVPGNAYAGTYSSTVTLASVSGP